MTIISPRSGFDLEYYIDKVGELTVGGYYLNAAQNGERPGRWFGRGAAKFGLVDGMAVQRGPYQAIYNLVDPVTGEKMPGRAPANYRHYYQILGELLDLEPEATGERVRELEREAAQHARRSPLYTDFTVEHYKSVSILHGSMRENIRRAKLAGDKDAEQLWISREERFAEILQEANHAGLAYIERYASVTRVGYGGQVREQQASRYAPGLMVGTTWLQGTNRDGEMHDHSHNVISSRVLCEDGVWRALDTMAVRYHLGGMNAVVDLQLRARLTREFGVTWVRRDDDHGYEVEGISRGDIETYSTRTSRVKDKELELSREWERRTGRQPNSREMRFIGDAANLATRRGKDDEPIDWDKLAEEWDSRPGVGGRLASLCRDLCNFGEHEVTGPPEVTVQNATIRAAIFQVQSKHSNWRRGDLMEAMACNMGQEYMTMDPDALIALLEAMTDEALNTTRYDVVCQEAPQWPPLPGSLIRDTDNRSVFLRPGTTKYTTRYHLDMEERMLQQAQRGGAPALSREFAAACLGTTVAQVEAVLTEPANDVEGTTSTGLRLDQAAVAWWALTSGTRASVGCGPAGCIAGETEIWDPIANRGVQVKQLVAENRRPWVQTLAGPVLAEVPFAKGHADLYRVTLADGKSCLVTEDHLFLSRAGWTMIGQPRQTPRACEGAGPLGGLAVGMELLSGSPADAPHCSGTAAGCQDRCSTCCRRCDPLLPPGSVADLASVPSRAGVHARSHSGWLQDDQASTTGRSQTCRSSGHPSMMSSAGLLSGGPSGEPQASAPAMLDAGCPCVSGTPERAPWSCLRPDLSHPGSPQLQPSPSRSRGASCMRRSGHGASVTRTCSNYRSQWVSIVQIIYERTDVYYDLHVPGEEHYLADGMWSHNSGKTRMAAEVAKAWEANGGRVIGLTTAQTARDILVAAGVRTAFNTTRFLKWVTEGKITIRQGDLLLVDEASMVSMSHLAQIINLAERHGAKVLAIGDHEQLSAVEQGGGFRLLADHLGFTQLAVPVRFEEEWERAASLRLRVGDKAALDDYDEHGRIIGAGREDVIAYLRRDYVASRLADEQTILMAYTREDCRTLGRLIREDLIHLRLVHDGREAKIAGGLRASAGDLIVNTKNDKLVTDQTGGTEHKLTNGDVFRVESVQEHSLFARRMVGSDPDTGRPMFANRGVILGSSWLQQNAELAYAVTGHKGQGATEDHGRALITGTEPRNWVYVATTRGRKSNRLVAVTHEEVRETPGPEPQHPSKQQHAVPVRSADTRQGTRPDPEIERYEQMLREREALLQPNQPVPEDARRAIGVIADCLEREDAEESATEHRQRNLADMDHLMLLGGQFDDLAGNAERQRYERLILGAVPVEYHTEMAEPMTWMVRSLRAAEAAGVPAEKVVRVTTERPFTGVRHAGKVLTARMQKLVDPMIPAPPRPYSERVPAILDPGTHEYVTEVAAMMDDRINRLAEHQAEHPQPWALNALGVVPDDPAARQEWIERAKPICHFRERFGYHDPAEAIGEEPSAKSPEKRQVWYAAFGATANTTQLDLSGMPDHRLQLMIGGYVTATSWAPPNVSRLLREVRLGKETMRIEHERATAEAKIATDPIIRARQDTIASKALSLMGAHDRREALLQSVADDRKAWSEITAGPRAVAVQAHQEMRKRHPERKIEPLKSAEPEVPEGALKMPDWLAGLAEQRARFRENYETHRGVRMPASEPDFGHADADAFPVYQPQRDAILQPAQREIRPTQKAGQPQQQPGMELQP